MILNKLVNDTPLFYRVWCCNKSRWEQGSVALFPDGKLFDTRLLIELNKKCHIIEQGLLAQGKLVYAGDILKITLCDGDDVKQYTTPVIFKDGAFLIQSGSDDYDTFLTAYVRSDGYPLSEIEVIGNIHENPELLEVQKCD